MKIEWEGQDLDAAEAAMKSHAEAMALISGAHSATTLSYEEAIAVYLRARGILRDGNEMLGAPIPADWNPTVQ